MSLCTPITVLCSHFYLYLSLHIEHLNLYINNPDVCYSNEFQVLRDTFSLRQFLWRLTNKNGHILDMVITKSTCAILKNIHVTPTPACLIGISDHSMGRVQSQN